MNDNGSCSCAPGYKNLNMGRDLNCQVDNCPTNSTLIPGGWNNTGICQCNSGFQKAPGKTGDRDVCFQSCQSGWDMQSDGTCKPKPRFVECPSGQLWNGSQCVSMPCNNGDIVANISGSYSCICRPGYTPGTGGCVSTQLPVPQADVDAYNFSLRNILG
jgi:hypothetical protein